MDKGFIFVYTFVVLMCSISCVDCRKCFECRRTASPQECGNITICNADEFCFTEQIVTTTGNVIFNSGCSSKQQCPVSRRDTSSIKKRLRSEKGNSKRDISICKECCTSDFCNMRGCGVPETPREQRGPYCYHCDGLQNTSSCRNVLLCSKDEVCGVYARADSAIQGEIRSTCFKQSKCDMLVMQSSQKCPTKCCKDDFCNEHCAKMLNGSVTMSPYQKTTIPHISMAHTDLSTTGNLRGSTSAYISTTATSGYPHLSTGSRMPYIKVTSNEHSSSPTTYSPVTTKASMPDLKCDTRGDYVDLADVTRQTHLCVHFVSIHSNWQDAQIHCELEGGHLAILDTLNKSQLLRQHLHAKSEHGLYWIGARASSHGEFTWVNGRNLEGSEADWNIGQPNGHKTCISIEKKSVSNQVYQWHDKNCSLTIHFICERPFIPNVLGRVSLSTTTGSLLTTTARLLSTTGSNLHTSHTEPKCDTRGGYHDLQSKDGHTRLCVHIVEHHTIWNHAKGYCNDEHGELVVLDTLEKSQLLRNELIALAQHNQYWIGARDFKGNDHFQWINQHFVHGGSQAEWGHAEPDNEKHGHRQDCVGIERHDEQSHHFLWYAKRCSETIGYICERSLVP